MIQPALPPTSLPAMLPIDSLLPGAASGPEMPDFAALLASTTVTAAPAGTAAPEPAALPPAVAEALAAASAEPATGKILPPTLPQVATSVPPTESPETTETQAAPQSAQPVMPQLGRAHQPAKVAATRRSQEPRGDRPEAEADKEAEPAAKVGQEIAPQALAISPAAVANTDQPAAPQSVAAQGAVLVDRKPADPVNPARDDEPRDATTARALPAPAARALTQAAPQAAFHRAIDPGAPTGPAAPTPSAEAAPRAPAQLRVETVPPAMASAVREERPVLAARRGFDADLRPARPAEALAEPIPAPSTVSDTLALPTSPASSANAPLATQMVRPHDFTALVDRLVAAREAVQPHAATLTVAHADFGPVELRFRHEDRGLAVSIASADPDFARAAQAAPQPVVPVSAGTAAQNDPGQPATQRESFAASANASGGQSRGQHGERRGEQPAQSNHGQRGPVRPGSERRSGIFA